MRAPNDLPPHLGPAFHTRDALNAGLLKERLRRADLTHPFRAVHTRRAPTDLEALCRAYLQRAGDDEYFSHATAARLWGLPLPAHLEERSDLDVAVSLPAHPPQATGVIGHRIQRPVRVVRLRGLPVTRPVETWIELARYLNVDDLVEVGDVLVRREKPYAALDDLFAAVARAKGVRGVGRLRRAVQLVRTGTDSPRETRTRLILVHAGLPEPVIGHAIWNAGSYVGTPDLAYVEQRIAIEYEGDVHRTDRRTFRNDIERKERFQDATWRYIRVTADHHAAPASFVRRVERALNKP